MKLNIELVPKTAWFKNLRNLVGNTRWDEIRKEVYKEYNYQCGICGTKGKISCHEIWEYEDVNKIQTLIGYLALCDDCHNIKHIGLSKIRAGRGELNLSLLIKHFMKVNNCSLDDFNKHCEEAFRIWRERSHFKWKLNLSKYIKEEPQRTLC